MTPEEIEARFDALKPQLQEIYTQLRNDRSYAHTSVIVPSFSVNQEELAKVLGAVSYEERLLFALIRLRNPNARVIYVTSQPISDDIIDYYLDLLEGVPMRQARQRIHILNVNDASKRPLTEKVLERPRFLERLRRLIGDPARAYLTCYNSTALERELAVALGIPLNGVDPDLLSLGSKTGNREIFRAAGVRFPEGTEHLSSEDGIVDALIALGKQQPSLAQAVVKINEGFGGEGNGVFDYPAERDNRDAVRENLHALDRTSQSETYADFLRKFEDMGGIVEAFVALTEVRSPSVQMRISPLGELKHVSSHEQVLGGATGQSYLGCRFPASDEYRELLLRESEKIGQTLADRGVIGRFGIDFLVGRNAHGDIEAHAIEINLRMGGTTPPFMALEFLTGGEADPETGLFRASDGGVKYYTATDNLKSPDYRGLLPEDLIDIIARSGLGYRQATGTGALFHMIGALSQFGKIGVTCIANTPEQASGLFHRVREVLDAETKGESHSEVAPLLDRYVPME